MTFSIQVTQKLKHFSPQHQLTWERLHDVINPNYWLKWPFPFERCENSLIERNIRN